MSTLNFEFVLDYETLLDFILFSIKDFTEDEFKDWLKLDLSIFPLDELMHEYSCILKRLEREELFEKCAILRDHIECLPISYELNSFV